MKVYCITDVDDRYMFPVSNTKIYKRLGDARKACDKINAKRPDGYIKATVLVADNWHKEENQ